ncbi:TenA family protein [Baaleninema sp.]|uniref:TenA family protein n=1 Tax=Baaleninema sp. TaxID=3101197 RepID=UPI003D05B6C8
MTLSDLLWNANRDLAQACLEHPFVQGLASGTLPPEKFATYTGQDTFFLKAFARAYSVAAAKSPDWTGFQTFHRLAEGVLEEMTLHRSYAEKWGVDLEAIEPTLATRHYIDFLSATAWTADVGTTAAAMSPCMRLYLFLGRELSKDGIPDHQYSEWISTYGSDEFEPLATRLEALVDRYGIDTPALRDTYRYAMQCELDFFESAWQAR